MKGNLKPGIMICKNRKFLVLLFQCARYLNVDPSGIEAALTRHVSRSSGKFSALNSALLRFASECFSSHPNPNPFYVDRGTWDGQVHADRQQR